MKTYKYIPTSIILAQAFAVSIWFVISIERSSNSPKNSSELMIPVVARTNEPFLDKNFSFRLFENHNKGVAEVSRKTKDVV